jgi:hypothetical protein
MTGGTDAASTEDREVQPHKNTTPKDRHDSQALYSSKIIKAGAILADTKTLLAHWDLAGSAQDNMERAQRDNLFGKASRSRVSDVLAIFRQRLLGEEAVARALAVLVK